MLKVDQEFIAKLQGGLPPQEALAKMAQEHGVPARPWHEDKLLRFFDNLVAQQPKK